MTAVRRTARRRHRRRKQWLYPEVVANREKPAMIRCALHRTRGYVACQNNCSRRPGESVVNRIRPSKDCINWSNAPAGLRSGLQSSSPVAGVYRNLMQHLSDSGPNRKYQRACPIAAMTACGVIKVSSGVRIGRSGSRLHISCRSELPTRIVAADQRCLWVPKQWCCRAGSRAEAAGSLKNNGK